MNCLNKKPKLQDEDFILESDSHIEFFETNTVSRYISVYLDEEIKLPKYYRPLLQVIEGLTEDDTLSIHVNTYGGSLDGATCIIQAMKNTPAEVVVTLDGRAASAGSMICLAASNLVVGPYADLMIHQGSFGSSGTQSNVISHAVFEDNRVKKIMQECYEGFLTDAEMNGIFLGVEMWFDFDEIIKRLDQRDIYMKEKYRDGVDVFEEET
jgi:ATP-dependent protease ClpP protease subunit